jgi:hypothetical protein
MEVQVTWTCDVTMAIRVHSYYPAPGSIAEKTHCGLDGKPLGVKSLPIGITEGDISSLEKSCFATLESVLKDPSCVLEITGTRASALTRLCLGSVIGLYNEMKPVSTKYVLDRDILRKHRNTPSFMMFYYCTRPSATQADPPYLQKDRRKYF